jgi:hypothetical protein
MKISKSLYRSITRIASPLAFIIALAVLLVPNLFINGQELTISPDDIGYDFKYLQDKKISLCISVIVCNIHFSILRGAYGHTLLSNQILIDIRGINKGVLYKKSDTTQFRTLKSVIEHELAHVEQRKLLGFFRFLITRTWILEGAAESISSEHSLKNISLFDACNVKPAPSSGFSYAQYRLIYLEELKGNKFLEIANENTKFSVKLDEHCYGLRLNSKES